MARVNPRKATKSKRKKKPSEMLLVASKVKQAIRAHKVNVASDAATALNEVVHWYIEQAARRASANGRKTVRSHDFLAF
ncbi:MAG: hypothetical protein ACE5HD_08175 [Acidobacteriota bacterium]